MKSRFLIAAGLVLFTTMAGAQQRVHLPIQNKEWETPFPAFKIGEKVNDPTAMYLSDIYTVTGDLAGIPCMSVPCGLTADGLPVGLQIITRHFDESTMFRIADAYENASH